MTWDELQGMPPATPEEDAAINRALSVAYDWNENGDILRLGVLRAIREAKASVTPKSRRTAERKAWARLAKAALCLAVAHAAQDIAAIADATVEHALAKQALADMNVDVDALLEGS